MSHELAQRPQAALIAEVGARLLRDPTNVNAITAAYAAVFESGPSYDYDAICCALVPLRHALLFERATTAPLRTVMAYPRRTNRTCDLDQYGLSSWRLPNRPLYVDCMRALRCRAAMLECCVRGVFATLPPEALADIVLHSCFDAVNLRALSASYPYSEDKWRLPSDLYSERLWNKARRDLVWRCYRRRGVV